MNSPQVTTARRGAFVGLGFITGFVAALGLALIAGGVWWWRAGTTFDVSQPTVVHQIQQLQRLETVVYTLEKIVTGDQSSRFLPRLLGGDRLLLIVHGEVTAGVDLAALDGSKVSISGTSVNVTLPPATLFSTRLDNARTRVYARETGLFTAPDPQLESDVRREAERQLTQAALDGGILNTAAANARSTLTSLLHGFGFDAVTFR
ncbi:MAG TPA: DUF4230 domain-containing protein [Vicinamibacterales bacterium]|nr:DUF4230 domain-containing protein [Vicinamibacterales bacterium]